MEVLWGIVFTAILVAISMAVFAYLRGYNRGLNDGIRETERSYHYQLTSVLTRQRGTPEQERGSDDTG